VEIKEELDRFLKSSSSSEQEILRLFLKSLQIKRKNPEQTNIAALMQLESEITDDATLEMEMPNTPLLDNSIGIMHGGLTATLLDTAMGTLASRASGSNSSAVTVEMKVDFLSPGIGERFYCRAKIVHNGSKLVRTEGKVKNESGALIATASGTFFKLKKEGE
jgi:uncharacterized protein (TIGR00369 family)